MLQILVAGLPIWGKNPGKIAQKSPNFFLTCLRFILQAVALRGCWIKVRRRSCGVCAIFLPASCTSLATLLVAFSELCSRCKVNFAANKGLNLLYPHMPPSFVPSLAPVAARLDLGKGDWPPRLMQTLS